MSELLIRKATREELHIVRELVYELAVFEKEPDALIATSAEYEQAYDEGLIDVFVACQKDEIIGMALFYSTFSTWKGKTLYLEDFYVKPEIRNMGIGQKLFNAFLHEAKKLGARQAKWQVLDWNTEAQRFYVRNNAVLEKNWWNGKILIS
ncbi:MAG: GNAT family N-acetyltransferase [Saprospiraceae bacterium]|jgi:GNAT superfamily N-acetyltransferase|nr:GNAT family N-acetyltransferase [Saprospiraceae bacterium]